MPLPRTGPGSAKTACCGPLWVQTGKIGQVLPECPLLEDPVLRESGFGPPRSGVDWGAPGRVTSKKEDIVRPRAARARQTDSSQVS